MGGGTRGKWAGYRAIGLAILILDAGALAWAAPVAGAATSVSGVSVSVAPPSSAAGASTDYGIGFTVSSSGRLSGQTGGTVTITLPTGTGLASLAAFSSTLTDTSTGVTVGSCSRSSSLTASCPLFTNAVINAGDRAFATLGGVVNPGVGAYTVQVSTSADATAATSSSYTITAAQHVTTPTVSVSGPAVAGAETSYGVTFNVSTTGELLAGAQSTISVLFPAGTALASSLAFNSQVQDITTGQMVGGCNGSGVTATCGIDSVVNPGDEVTVNLGGITNPGVGSYTLQVATSSDTTPATSPSYTIAVAHPVTTPSVTIADHAAGALTSYAVAFNVSSTGELAGDLGSITISLPSGTTMSVFSSFSSFVEDTTSAQTVGSCGSNGSTAICSLNFSAVVHAGDRVTVNLNGVTNPGMGSYSLQVSTSSDPAPVSSSTYPVAAGQKITTPNVVLSDATAGATGVTYEVTFDVSSSGELAGNVGSTISVVLPAGTGLAFSLLGKVEDSTTDQEVGFFCSTAGLTVQCPLNTGTVVHAGDHLTVSFEGVTNPSQGSQTLEVSTSSDVTPVPSGTYTVGPPLPMPTIKKLNPTGGAVGSNVVIKGSHLSRVLSVTFNGTPASVITDTSSRITTQVPFGATTGPVKVQTAGGTVTSASNFTVS